MILDFCVIWRHGDLERNYFTIIDIGGDGLGGLFTFLRGERLRLGRVGLSSRWKAFGGVGQVCRFERRGVTKREHVIFMKT